MTNDMKDLLPTEAPVEQPQQRPLSNLLSDSNGKPEDIFATMHYTYAPMVLQSLPSLSKKEMRRVVEALVDIPPKEQTLKAFNPAQTNVFWTLEKVLFAKYSMMYHVALEQEMKKELKEKEQGVISEPVLDSTNTGSTNTTPTK